MFFSYGASDSEKSLESGAERKLYPLPTVYTFLLIQGLAERKAQRAEGRTPRETEARRVPHVAELYFFRRAKDLAAIDERRQAQGLLHLRTRQGEKNFGAAGD